MDSSVITKHTTIHLHPYYTLVFLKLFMGSSSQIKMRTMLQLAVHVILLASHLRMDNVYPLTTQKPSNAQIKRKISY